MKTLNTRKIKSGNTITGALFLLASVSTSASASASASNETAIVTPFTMTVMIDEAHGRKVESGKYDVAVDQITSGGLRSPERFAEQNNLCVAYAKLGDLEKAIAACDAAVVKAKERQRLGAMHYARTAEDDWYRRNLAIALSNRGVLLAVRGDADLAKVDFLAAIELETPQSDTVSGNLVRLGQISAT